MNSKSARNRINFLKVSTPRKKKDFRKLGASAALCFGITAGYFVQFEMFSESHSAVESAYVAPKITSVNALQRVPAAEKPLLLDETLQLKLDAVKSLAHELELKNIPEVQETISQPGAPGVQITLDSDTLFESGTATLDDHAKTALQEIESLVKKVSGTAVVEIEGHTDDSPIVRQKKFFPSNWELSAARAASLIPLFERAGVEKDKLRVIGYGDSRPVALNQVPESSKNRRIVLRIFPLGDSRKNL